MAGHCGAVQPRLQGRIQEIRLADDLEGRSHSESLETTHAAGIVVRPSVQRSVDDRAVERTCIICVAEA